MSLRAPGVSISVTWRLLFKGAQAEYLSPALSSTLSLMPVLLVPVTQVFLSFIKSPRPGALAPALCPAWREGLLLHTYQHGSLPCSSLLSSSEGVLWPPYPKKCLVSSCHCPGLALLILLHGTLFFFSRSVVSDSLWPPGLLHTRLPCPSLSPRACSNSVHWVGDAITRNIYKCVLICNMFFSLWVTSLYMTVSRSIHISANGKMLFLFMANIPLYICATPSLTIPPSMDI